MKFGIVTYQIAQDWDMPTLIDMCQKTGLQGVELRTTHAHKVEADLTPEQRREVKKQFEDAGIEIVGLGTIFQYHAVEPEPLASDHPLWGYENVIITPHASGHSPHAKIRMFNLFCENLRRFVNSEPLINIVDLDLQY